MEVENGPLEYWKTTFPLETGCFPLPRDVFPGSSNYQRPPIGQLLFYIQTTKRKTDEHIEYSSMSFTSPDLPFPGLQ